MPDFSQYSNEELMAMAGVESFSDEELYRIAGIPVIKQAKPETLWEKATGGIRDLFRNKPEGQMAPSEIADAQIKTEAREEGLTKEAYMRKVYPQGEIMRKGERYAKGVVRGGVTTIEGMAGGLEWLSEGSIGNDLANQSRLWASDLTPEEMTFSDELASGFGSMGTFFIPGLGVAKGATALAKLSPRLGLWMGASTSAAMEAMTEAGQVYRDVIAATRDIKQAESAAIKTFWANIPLLVVTNKLGIFGEKGGVARRSLTSGAMEGTQEAGQEIISTLAKDESIKWGDVATSGAVGAITGAIFGGLAAPSVRNILHPHEATQGVQGGGKGTDLSGVPTEKLQEIAGIKEEKKKGKKAKAETVVPTTEEILQEGEKAKQEFVEKKKEEAAHDRTDRSETIPGAVREGQETGGTISVTEGGTEETTRSGILQTQEGQEEGEGEEVVADLRGAREEEKEEAKETEGAGKREAPKPHLAIAGFVKDRLDKGETFTKKELWYLSDEAYAGRKSEGKYTPKDAYDAMELGVNKHIMESKDYSIDTDIEGAKKNVAKLKELIDKLPTQTNRTEEHDEFQQFSTPPPLAYVANWVANIKATEKVLEPSAGVGGLAVFAKKVGARVAANELSQRRAEILKDAGMDRVYTENAEQLNNVLPAGNADVVVMNPPFSATAGRIQGQRKTANAGVHIEQALKRVEEGGRLVAIVGEGMALDRPAFRAWWNKIKGQYNVRANIGISGKEYAKYGTTWDNQIVVIDNTGPTTGKVLTGKVDKIDDLIDLLKEVRDERGTAPKREAAKPTGETVTQKTKSAGERGPVIQPPTGDVGAGERKGGGKRKRPGAKTVTTTGREGIQEPVKEDHGRDSGHIRVEEGVLPEERGEATERGEPGGVSERTGGVLQRPGDVTGAGLGTDKSISEIKVENKEKAVSTKQLTEAIFEEYEVKKVNTPGAKKHPGALVESAAMAAVDPPTVTYQPKLPQKVVESGAVSDAQLEAVVYAGAAHNEMLPSGERKGYFIGDGTGVGKGREIGAILWDNWNHGRKRSVWISKNRPLIEDAKRDVNDVGWDSDLIFDLGSVKFGSEIKTENGICFAGYATLRSKRGKVSKGETEESRLDQLVAWLGKDFDGVVVFDEAHTMGNAIAIKGKRGTRKPSQTALAGLRLQELLPNARVLYVSATGATEVTNLAYAERLGLWGANTAFSTKHQFFEEIQRGGISAMEVVAHDLKAQGLYCARSLSYHDVKYDRLEHTLTKEQREVYNELAGAWEIVLNNINSGMELTGITEAGKTKNSDAKKNIMGHFWSTNQRFWNQIITAMQIPSVIAAAEQDMKNGHCPVFQFVNTNEAQLNRQAAQMTELDEVEDLDLTPREGMMQYVKKHYPTIQYEEYMDEEGNIHSRPVKDSQGNWVENAEAVAQREELLTRLATIRVPDSPLDMILNHFGEGTVAEVTGRTRRVVKDPDTGKKALQKWSTAKSSVDARLFADGKKRLLLFSDAGGTGRSYHASNAQKNQALRKHYIVQPGWRADNALQGLGRTHRTNQAQAPEYSLVTTDLQGQKRFISSIARRLDQLGALTKGQREAGSQGLFNARDNLESIEAEDALNMLVVDIVHGGVEGVSVKDFEYQAGLKVTDQYGNLSEDKMPDMPQFMNRILNMRIETQNKIFEEFSHRFDETIAAAIKNGTLDQGIETIKAKKVSKVSEQAVYTDPKTGAETKYVELDLTHDARLLPFHISEQYAKTGYYRNIKSGRIWAVGNMRSKTDEETGAIVLVYSALAPNYHGQVIESKTLTDEEKWEKLSRKAAEKAWEKEYEALPKEIHEKAHMITGLILPVWDRLPTKNQKIYRVQTEEGERIIGRQIPSGALSDTLKRLGASANGGIVMTAEDIFNQVLHNNIRVTLANDWYFRRKKVADEYRIELRGPAYQDMNILKQYGVFTERVNWESLHFIPAEKETGVDAISKIIAAKPVTETTTPYGARATDVTLKDIQGITLDSLGFQNLYDASLNLYRKLNPKAAANIKVVRGKEGALGVVRGLLGSPSRFVGKAKHYVVHGKNAVVKQERLRGIAQAKMDEIFNPLDTDELRQEFEGLQWLGDAEGRVYTQAELEEMGVSPVVQEAYLKHRRFHSQAWRLLKAHRKAFGYNVEVMEGLEGHIPHLFENWNVYEMTENAEGEVVPGNIVGTFRSLREATLYSNALDPQKEYTIMPKAFRMPEELLAKTVLKDTSYYKMIERVEQGFSITRDEAKELVSGVARRKNKHRFLGNLMKRKGQTGFRQDDLHSILKQYYYSVARYVALDDFKARVTPKFERDFGVEVGKASQAIRDKNVARYVEEYINDINGVPGMLEDMIDATIKKAFGQYVSSQRPTIWTINKLMHFTAVCKLGLFNLSAGVVNLTQLINTFSQVPAKDFFWAAGKVLGKHVGAMTPADKALLRRIGIEYDLGLTDTGGYSAIHKGGRVVRGSMVFFHKAEYINRAITALAAYRHARKEKGYSQKKSRMYAREMVDRTQFDYSVADTGRIFRNPAGRFIGQFKPFAIKQIEFMTGLKGAQHIKFWIPYLLLAATAGIPLIESIAELIEWLTGYDPLMEYKRWLMEWAGDDPTKKKVARVAMYGLLSLLNIDISRRVGTGDVLPKRVSELLGPTINTLINAKEIMERGDKSEFVKSIAPSVGNLINAIEAVQEDMQVKDPYHRERLRYEATKGDIAVKAMGLRPVREAELADVEKIREYETKRYTKTQQKYVDQAIEALMDGDADKLSEAIVNAAEEGVVVDDKAIESEIIQKVLPQEIRTLLKTRAMLRPGHLDLIEYLNTND